MYSTAFLIVTVCVLNTVNGHSPAVLEIPASEEIDYERVMKLWNNISSAWCTDEDIPLKAMNDAYECFRKNRGELEHNLQVLCERKIFALSLSQNEIRKRMCRLEPEILAKFEKCYAEGGENTTAEILEDAHLLDADRHKKRVEEFHKFESLAFCMKKAFGWDKGQMSLVKSLPKNMWRSYVGTGLEKDLHPNNGNGGEYMVETVYEYESVDFDDYA